jgi:putative sugar O-methyltransferase
MIQIIHKTIRVNLEEDFNIKGDKDLFNKIVADQEKHAGLLRPSENWDLDIGGQDGGKYFHHLKSKGKIEAQPYTEEKFDELYSTLLKMISSLVGSVGSKTITDETIEQYYQFINGLDHLGIVPNYFDEEGKLKKSAKGLKITDLGSIIDINFITAYLDYDEKPLKVLEVGGGYGRLAETFLNTHKQGTIKYVLLDAVPASLMYAYLYLSKNFPKLNIGFYYNKDPFDLNSYDCYIVPAWHFDSSQYSERIDCCINIQSMQEMNQYHVDYYMKMFDELLKPSTGIVYISNEKDYIFQGDWNYPDTWKRLIKTRTPRSWTRNSPTEIFIKGTSVNENHNKLIDFVYSFQLDCYDEKKHQE